MEVENHPLREGAHSSREGGACRKCHRFTNPYGLRSQVGTGTGWHFHTPVKPTPVTWVSRVLLGYENINKQPISI